MTYALSWPLQEAIFAVICESDLCNAFFGHRVFDAPPPFQEDAVPEGLYLTLGDEQVQDWSTATNGGAVHTVTLTVHAPRRGFSEAKQAAAALSDAITSGNFSLSRGRVVNARFIDARTKRAAADALRQIEMRFRLTLEDTH